MAPRGLSMTLSVKDLPEMVWLLRSSMAELLRDEASTEADPRIARRLREIADVFEVGGKA
jgi:hypothetical protein